MVVETVNVAMVVTADTTEEVETAEAEVMDVARLRLTDPDPIGIIDPALDLTVLVATKKWSRTCGEILRIAHEKRKKERKGKKKLSQCFSALRFFRTY